MPLPTDLLALDAALVQRGSDLALYLVYDRPDRESERPGLARLHFARRCQSDEGLETTTEIFRAIDAYVELFAGEQPFMSALTSGRLDALGRSLQIAYNGIGWGIGTGGFMPGRKALVPLLADSYNIASTNADAYACAFTLHKFHSFLVLAALGVPTPRTWQYRAGYGWLGTRPAAGTRVIAKSTYEAWSIGVTESSVFHVDDQTEERLQQVADDIGQPVTVQEFVAGTEVCVPVISRRTTFAAPPMEAIVTRAPGDPDAFMTVQDTMTAGGYAHRIFDGPTDLVEELQTRAVEVYRALELGGLSRLDFRVDQDGRPWLIDVAVEPAIGVRGSAYTSFSALGVDHPTFMRLLVATSLEDAGLLTAPTS